MFNKFDKIDGCKINEQTQIVFYIAAKTVFKRNFTRPDHPDGGVTRLSQGSHSLQEPGRERKHRVECCVGQKNRAHVP